MSDIQFQGVVAVGSTRKQAINNYRLLSMGKGAAVFVDEGNRAFVANASSTIDSMFNPNTGDLDLTRSDAFLKDLSFTSVSSGDVQEAYHHQCLAGCGQHLVFDAKDFVTRCPSCATSLSADGSDDEDEDDLSDDELDNLDAGSADDSADDGLDDSDSDDDDADSDDDSDSDSDEDEDEESTSSADSEDESDDSDDDSDDDDDDADLDADDLDADTEDDSSDDSNADSDDDADRPVVIAATAKAAIQGYAKRFMHIPPEGKSLSSSDSIALIANYKVCSSNTCGCHVVSAEELTVCPNVACCAALEEPQDTDAVMSLFNEDEADGQDTDADQADDADADADSDDDLGTDDGQDTDEVVVDSLETLPEDTSGDDLDVSYSASLAGAPAWTAYVKGRPVAIATADSVKPEHRDLFNQPRFGSATLAAARASSVPLVLSSLGFKGIATTLNVSKTVQERAEALADDMRTKIAAENEQSQERLEAALATAAMGITRGFWRNETNPIRESLVVALASAGVRQPEILVDNAISTSMDAFLRNVFIRAKDIVSKPAEVQESLSHTIVGTNFRSESSASNTSFEARLGNIGATKQNAAATQDVSNTETAVATAAASDSFNQLLVLALRGM